MWFIIRSVFCVGLVYSMATGERGIGDFRDVASGALTSLGTPAAGALLGSALGVCDNDPGFCFEAARRWAGGVDPREKSAKQAQFILVSDTLTAADRIPAWRGAAKPQSPAGRGRGGTPPHFLSAGV
jgi:hypothetical protein